MIKITAVAMLVLIPILWGALMIPVLNFFEKIILKISARSR